MRSYDEMLTVKRLPQNYCDPNTYEHELGDTSDTVLLYSPTQRPGSLSFMVRLRDRVITVDGVYLTPVLGLLF